VTIEAGTTSAAFRILTTRVDSEQKLDVTAREGAATAKTVLTLEPLQISALSLSPAGVVGGATAQGTITLNGPASDSSSVVRLASTDAAAGVPSSVAIRLGSSSATFPVATRPVARSTHATIKATLGDSASEAALTVRPVSR